MDVVVKAIPHPNSNQRVLIVALENGSYSF